MRLAVIAVRTFANTSVGQVRTASKDSLALIASPSVEKETLDPSHLYASSKFEVPVRSNTLSKYSIVTRSLGIRCVSPKLRKNPGATTTPVGNITNLDIFAAH
jgi:hypothetical protein